MRLLSTLLLAAVFAGAGDPQLQIESRKKPTDPWTARPTRSLDQLRGFKAEGADGPLCTYGGIQADKSLAKGFFYPRTIDGRWWLIDPDGCRFIHVGVVSVAPGRSLNSRAAFAKAFGSDPAWADQVAGRLEATGFNGVGAWSDWKLLGQARTRMVYTVMWNFMSAYGKQRGGTFQQPGHTGYPNDCIFVFDPEFERFCDELARTLAATRDDPWLLGHFSDNELPFRKDALDRYLALPDKDPGRLAAETWLRSRGGASGAISDGDREAFLAVVVDRYFRITTQAIRKYDPNHLCLGSRFHGSILALPEVFKAAGKYLDVVSVNYYNTWTPDPDRMRSWEQAAGRPFIVTEWYVKGMDSGMPNTTGAGWEVRTQRDRGLFYQNFALALIESRSCVGWHWFKYMDNDPDDTTTDPSNRDSNKGIVSFRYVPYEPLLEAMQRLNRRVYSLAAWFDRQRREP